jgi:hypothetical protein
MLGPFNGREMLHDLFLLEVSMVMMSRRLVRKLGLGAVLSASAMAAQAVSFCVFDIVGTSGDAFNMSRDYAVAMQREGVNIDLKVYTNEAKAVEDFRAGRCDAVIATGFRTRPFNGVAASVDALGSSIIVRNGVVDMTSSYDVMRKLVQTFAADRPQVTRLMTDASGKYEVGGILPVGAAYLVGSDRRYNTVEKLAGKRMAALDYDPAQAVMIKRINAIPVPSDISNISQRLSSGAVDFIAAPALAYKPLGLDKGVGERGGVARFPLMIMSYQVIFDRSKFPEGFGARSRVYWLGQFDRVLQLIRKAESDIPAATWVELSPENTYRYTLMLREARIDIAQMGLYDKRGLKILKRIRCHVNPVDPECKSKSEEEWPQ